MARSVVATWLCAAAMALASSALAVSAEAQATPGPLVACLESIARRFHVRIVDASGRATSMPCVAPARQATLQQALDQLLQPHGLDWHRLDDGTLEVVVAHAPSKLTLPALDIEGDPTPDVQRPEHPTGTLLAERATAVTSLDSRWLDTAPLLGFDQIGWYAPNVYGSGRSIAIRGTERDSDYFSALTVTFDGVELGTRMLDDELVPLDDVTNLSLARGPRTFEAAGGSQAGEISLKTAPPMAEPTASIALGLGDPGARNGEVSWSGPLGSTGLGATVALDEHELPSFVRQAVVPAATVDKRRNRFGRIKLRFAPDSRLSAEFDALALSGDSSDRQIVPPLPTPGQPATAPFDPFDRDSYATDPTVARTQARGAAGSMRYEEPDRWTIDAHVSSTSIFRDSTLLPGDARWTDRELRCREGLVVSEHPAQDWTIVAGLERDHVDTLIYTPVTASELIFSRFDTRTDSASLWLEHSWGSDWNVGAGVRWLHELTAASASAENGYGYSVPIPLGVVEWHPWTDQAFSLSYGTGFRSGGQVNAAVAGSFYVPERTQNLELAWRAQWLDGTLHTTLSAFDGKTYDHYTYYLTSANGKPVLVTEQDRGVELEFDDELSDRWRLRGGVGVLSSRFSSFIYAGDPTSEAPPQTATFGIRYGLALGWYGAADAYRAAAAEYYISSSPAGRLPAYDVLALRVGYRTARWETALVASNALDAQYFQRVQFSVGNQSGYRLGDPRRVELHFKTTW